MKRKGGTQWFSSEINLEFIFKYFQERSLLLDLQLNCFSQFYKIYFFLVTTSFLFQFFAFEWRMRLCFLNFFRNDDERLKILVCALE